jgi:putative oxidoreductase
MTTFTTAPSVTPVRRTRAARVARVSLWTVRILLSAQFVVGGVLKLTASPQMVAMFDDIGAGQWLRVLVGVCEVAGGIGVLVPWLARLAAAGLVGLMVGAAVTNVVALQISPVVPLVLLGLALLVAATRTRKESGR